MTAPSNRSTPQLETVLDRNRRTQTIPTAPDVSSTLLTMQGQRPTGVNRHSGYVISLIHGAILLVLTICQAVLMSYHAQRCLPWATSAVATWGGEYTDRP